MNKCNTLIDAKISSFQRFGRLDTNSNNTQASSCCNDSSCDSSHCSFSISFVAFFSNSEFETSFEPLIHIPVVEQRKIRVIASELFRPPRKIQS